MLMRNEFITQTSVIAVTGKAPPPGRSAVAHCITTC